MPANVRDSAQGSELGVSAPQTRLGRVGCHGGTRVLARCSPSVRPPLRMLEAWPRDAIHVVNTLLGCGAEFFFFQSWLSSRSKAIIPPPACVLWSHLEAQKTRFCGPLTSVLERPWDRKREVCGMHQGKTYQITSVQSWLKLVWNWSPKQGLE